MYEGVVLEREDRTFPHGEDSGLEHSNANSLEVEKTTFNGKIRALEHADADCALKRLNLRTVHLGSEDIHSDVGQESTGIQERHERQFEANAAQGYVIGQAKDHQLRQEVNSRLQTNRGTGSLQRVENRLERRVCGQIFRFEQHRATTRSALTLGEIDQIVELVTAVGDYGTDGPAPVENGQRANPLARSVGRLEIVEVARWIYFDGRAGPGGERPEIARVKNVARSVERDLDSLRSQRHGRSRGEIDLRIP